MGLSMHHLLFSAGDTYPTVRLVTTLEPLEWVSGARLPQAPPPLEFVFEAAEPFDWPDYLRPNSVLPLFSDAMREALGAAGATNVEYFPARVRNALTGEARRYHAANIVGMVPAMDRERSSFTQARSHPVMVRYIDRLVLDESRCNGLPLFRLAEYDLLIVIGPAVAQSLQSAALRGVRVVAPTDWDGLES